MDFHWNLCISIDLYRFPLIFHRFPIDFTWISIGTIGFPRNLQRFEHARPQHIHGFQFKSMDLHRCHCFSMESTDCHPFFGGQIWQDILYHTWNHRSHHPPVWRRPSAAFGARFIVVGSIIVGSETGGWHMVQYILPYLAPQMVPKLIKSSWKAH